MAISAGLDLVCFSSPQNGKPALCKIIDYGKWKYYHDKELKKQQLISRKTTKEIRLTPAIDTNDLAHKIGQIKEFLEGGDEVVISMRFKGIHKRMFKEGEEIVNNVVLQCKDFGIEHSRKSSGTNITVRLIH